MLEVPYFSKDFLPWKKHPGNIWFTSWPTRIVEIDSLVCTRHLSLFYSIIKVPDTWNKRKKRLSSPPPQENNNKKSFSFLFLVRHWRKLCISFLGMGQAAILDLSTQLQGAESAFFPGPPRYSIVCSLWENIALHWLPMKSEDFIWWTDYRRKRAMHHHGWHIF